MTDPEQLSNWNLADIAEDRRLGFNAKFEDGAIWFRLGVGRDWTYRTPEGAKRQAEYFRAEGRALDFAAEIESALQQYHAQQEREAA